MYFVQNEVLKGKTAEKGRTEPLQPWGSQRDVMCTGPSEDLRFRRALALQPTPRAGPVLVARPHTEEEVRAALKWAEKSRRALARSVLVFRVCMGGGTLTVPACLRGTAGTIKRVLVLCYASRHSCYTD